MEQKTFYYARVSEDATNLDIQLEAFHKLGAQAQEIFIDQEPARNTAQDRYQFLKKAALRAGDTLVIRTLGELAPSRSGIPAELQWLQEHGVRLKVIDLPTTMIELAADREWALTLISRLLMEAVDASVVQESAVRRKRQREGVDEAKAKGVRFGRPPLEKEETFDLLKQRWLAKEISTREAAKMLGVSHQTFWKWVKGA